MAAQPDRIGLALALIADGIPQKQICDEFGISRARLGQLLLRERRKGVAPPDGRRTIPVRLCDPSQDVRIAAAAQAAKEEPDETMRMALFSAAVFPSDNVYWIAA